LLNKLFPNQYSFVGTGDLVIGGKIPDFANGYQLIELFGEYWHRGDNPQDRIDHFAIYNYSCLVVWDYELKDEATLCARLREYYTDYVVLYGLDSQYTKYG